MATKNPKSTEAESGDVTGEETEPEPFVNPEGDDASMASRGRSSTPMSR